MDVPLWNVVTYKGNLVYNQTDRPMNRETGSDSRWTGEWSELPIKLERDNDELGLCTLFTSEEEPCWRCGDERLFEASERLADHYIQVLNTWP